MSAVTRCEALIRTAQGGIDDCRDHLSWLEQSVDDLTRRRRPVDRLDLDDILDAVKDASGKAAAARRTLDRGLEELAVTQDPVATAVLSLARQITNLEAVVQSRLSGPEPKPPRPSRRPS